MIYSAAKIVQGERRKSSLLELYAEPQPILCKDTKNNILDNKSLENIGSKRYDAERFC